MIQKKSLVLLAFAISIALLPLIVLAIDTGVLNVSGVATFDKDIRVRGIVIGTSHIEIEEGIDFLDANGLRRNSAYIQLPDQTVLRDIPDDLNGVFVFENATTLNPFKISWVFWDSVTERPTFVLQDGFVGRASIFERSLIIGKEKGAADMNLNYNVCPLGKMDLADCDTPLTGADLIVEDDTEVFGSIKTHENLIVDANITGNEFYGSMGQHDLGTSISLSNTTDFVPIDDMTLGLTNGVELSGTDSLRVKVAGTYLVVWSISFSDLANRAFEGGVGINSVVDTSTIAEARMGTAADQINFGSPGFISVNVDDLVSLEMRAVTASTTVDIEEASIILKRVGD